MDQSPSPALVYPYLRPALAGAVATLSGIGLARFAYVPLFPIMVASGWVSGAEAGFLGAVNLAGYVAGVLGGRAVAHRAGTGRALDAAMGLAVLAFAACAWNGGLLWLTLWRSAAGLAGGVLMALAGPAVQGAVEPSRRGGAGGIVMAGVGTGIIVASLAVSALVPAGLPAAWLGLAALVLGLWIFAHPRWPDTPITPVSATAAPIRTLRLHVWYATAGAGMVPHMVYFVDLAVRGRGLSAEAGAFTWFLFGAGGIAGTLAGGRAADRWGGVRGVRIWLALQAAAVGLALLPGALVLVPSALLGGFGCIGVTAGALARTREIAGSAAGAIWVRITATFAVVQALTGFAMTALFAHTGSHEPLFAAAFVLSVAALLVVLRES